MVGGALATSCISITPQTMSEDVSTLKKSEVAGDDTLVTLIPMTSAQNNRYDGKVFVRTEFLTIPKGLNSPSNKIKSNILPSGWSSFTHPEGPIYYAKTYENICVATDSAIDNPTVMATLQTGIDLLLLLLKDITSEENCSDVEIYISTMPAATECYYYFVDHNDQTVFWVQDVDMTTLHMSPVSSETHIKSILQEHYWTHVEYFPHRSVPLCLRLELMDILRHASADQMTSDNSTFPYHAEQCTKFAGLIDVQNKQTTIHMNCLVARIWVMIARHRYDHFYGEKCARLCRDQRVFDWTEVKPSFAKRLCSSILFDFPEIIRNRLEDLYVDQIVYKIHWDNFINSTKRGWRENALMCTGLLIANASFAGIHRNSSAMYTGLASMMLSIGGLLSGFVLLHTYEHADKVNAAATSAHLQDICSENRGFRPIAAVFSLPKALTFWSILFFFFDVSITVGGSVSFVRVAIPLSVAMLVLVAFAMIVAILRRRSAASMV
ncbi:hypothetical protein CERSUDRAFT_119253 [Gelatoporia subvermispora B]|uniref:Uncharacterized protein n=1 Tax=Ceriporiopsis subvermispora (strain B) TaxID=914234 RepID=M2P951_CERS8|nr:hypothetical protein CERSUDRAFT_119253 [Gelatoporia subvermispora B]